jgi:branched-chain amino acid transport system substrate-binding protein
MKKVVILTLDGDLESGLRVTLKQGERLKNAIAIQGQTIGQLSANPELAQLYKNWQEDYLRLEEICRTCRLALEDEEESDRSKSQLPEDYQTVHENCDRSAEDLKQQMNQWLNSSANGFERIRHQLVEQLRNPNVRLLIQTSNPQLQRFPWHLWDLCKRQDNYRVEVALSPMEYQEISSISWKKSIRILAILGNSNGINIQTDKAHLQKLGGSTSCFLEQPNRQELVDKLRDKEGWDILFFAGHSQSDRNGDRGRIYINDQESLSLVELKNAFGTAIQSRLKLAIFNSCDGLGLANELSQLNIPQAIVMREPVPDEVAHLFLEFFLEEFGKNQPVYQAVRIARERLESIENKLPYATWLPTIYQHPTIENRRPKYDLFRSLAGFGLGILAIAFFLHQRNFSKTCPIVLGDRVSCGEEIVVTKFSTLSKENAVKDFSTGKLQEALAGFEKFWNEDRKDPETLIYWNNTLLELSNAKYYTIAIIVPTERDNRGTIVNSDLAEELLRGVAQLQTEINLGLNREWSLPGREFLKGSTIHGKGLRVVIADDANQDSVKPLADSLVRQSQILGVVGCYFSQTSLKILDTLNPRKLVLISPSNTSKLLTNKKPDYFFRVSSSTQVEAKITEYLMNSEKQKSIIYYNPHYLSTHSFREDFKKYFTERGGEIIGEFNLSDSSNFNAEATIPDVEIQGEVALIIAPNSNPGNDSIDNAFDVVKANRDRHLAIVTRGSYSQKTLEIASQLPSFENLMLSVNWHPLSSPDRQFPQHAKRLWGDDVNDGTALTYDAAKAIVRAIELQEKPTREGTQKMLASPNFKVEGASGTIKFDQLGDRSNLPTQLLRIVPCAKEKFGVTFLPLGFETAEAAGLNCNN